MIHRHGRRARQLVVCLVAACAATAAVPGTAPAAKKASLRGQVVGTPYVADTRTAVPVLLSKESARKAGLRSPVGVVLIPRMANVPVPGGKSKPGNLRLGDRFRAVGEITKEARGAVYARVNVVPATMEIYRRGKTLSTAELEALVRQLQGELEAVKGKLTGLANYTLGELQKIRDDLSVLRGDITGLKAQLAALQAALDALKKQLESVTAELTAQIAGVLAQVEGLAQQVAGLVSQLTNLQSALTNVQNLLTGLTPGQLQEALGRLGAVYSLLAGPDGALGTADDTVAGILANVTSLQLADTALGTQITGVQTNLQGQITTLSGQLASVQQTLGIVCGNTSPLNALC